VCYYNDVVILMIQWPQNENQTSVQTVCLYVADISYLNVLIHCTVRSETLPLEVVDTVVATSSLFSISYEYGDPFL
jgi:hypothetical protein